MPHPPTEGLGPDPTGTVANHPLPAIIQGGMGVAVSDWRLARAVAVAGGLGVVSGTAIEVVCARRLQDGDRDGAVRRALAALPLPGVADRLITTYHRPEGRPPGTPYRPVPMFSSRPAARLQELAVAAGFVEVWLAKEGHASPVGINLLRKIEAPIPFVLYGALLAEVDAVLVGAGNPREIPALLTGLSRGEEVVLELRVQGGGRPPAGGGAVPDGTGPEPQPPGTTGPPAIHFDPASLFAGAAPPQLPRPRFLAIVASNDLAAGLAADAGTRPDGLIVEGPAAGGHNAPPRGRRQVDERDQPIYGDADAVDLPAVTALGLPVWLAGRFSTPAGLKAALAAGAAGIQVGTPFALCAESGMTAGLRSAVLAQIAAGELDVRTDWRASPTGFPFKIAAVPGTLSDAEVVADRPRVCDLGMLRVPVARDDGSLGYRCPAEPVDAYTRKGAREANTAGRLCLCNALLATAGFPQQRPDDRVEPGLVTLGSDLEPVVALLERRPPLPGDVEAAAPGFTAAEVIAYLRGAMGDR